MSGSFNDRAVPKMVSRLGIDREQFERGRYMAQHGHELSEKQLSKCHPEFRRGYTGYLVRLDDLLKDLS